jgi:hypothetical protein
MAQDEFTQQLELQMAELEEKERQLKQLPERILKEKRESAMTMPPIPGHADRERAKRHGQAIVTHGEVQNALREHNHSLAMLILLAACTASLVWWAMRVMG